MAQQQNNPMVDGFTDDYENPRGIKKAVFIENVESYVKKILKDDDLTDVSTIVKSLQNQRDQYDLLERTKLHKKDNLKKKVPEITKTLEAVEYLKQKREEDEQVNTHFQIADNIYVNAKLKKTDNVALWLGANVMVEYPFEDATSLLTQNLKMAQEMLEEVTEDLAYIKDQKTTTEVNISRVHNFGVKMRAKARAQQQQ